MRENNSSNRSSIMKRNSNSTARATAIIATTTYEVTRYDTAVVVMHDAASGGNMNEAIAEKTTATTATEYQ